MPPCPSRRSRRKSEMTFPLRSSASAAPEAESLVLPLLMVGRSGGSLGRPLPDSTLSPGGKTRAFCPLSYNTGGLPRRTRGRQRAPGNENARSAGDCRRSGPRNHLSRGSAAADAEHIGVGHVFADLLAVLVRLQELVRPVLRGDQEVLVRQAHRVQGLLGGDRHDLLAVLVVLLDLVVPAQGHQHV